MVVTVEGAVEDAGGRVEDEGGGCCVAVDEVIVDILDGCVRKRMLCRDGLAVVFRFWSSVPWMRCRVAGDAAWRGVMQPLKGIATQMRKEPKSTETETCFRES